MSTIKSDNSNLILNADGAGSEVKFHNNGVEICKVDATGFSGNGSNLTGIKPSLSILASGNLANGDAIIIQSDGTISRVTTSTTTTPITENLIDNADAKTIFNSGYYTYDENIAWDPHTENRFVLGYRDGSNNNYGACVVGSVDGSTITLGSEVTFRTDHTEEIVISFDPFTPNKIMITSYLGTAHIGTLSGLAVTFGSNQSFGLSHTPSSTFDPHTQDQVFVHFVDQDNGYSLSIQKGTVSGDTITWDTKYNWRTERTSSSAESLSMDPHTPNRFAIIYRDWPNSMQGRLVIGTYSGGSYTMGSETIFDAGTASYVPDWDNFQWDPVTPDKFIIAYAVNNDPPRNVNVTVGTVSGTTVTLGSPNQVSDGSDMGGQVSVAMDKNSPNKFVIMYESWADNSGKAKVGTISGTSITFGNEVGFNNDRAYHNDVQFDPFNAGKFLMCGLAVISGNWEGWCAIGQMGTDVISMTTNITDSNFLGFSNGITNDGNMATINIVGNINSGYSNLVPGTKYYIQTDGSIGPSPAIPNVFAGLSISPNEILIKG